MCRKALAPGVNIERRNVYFLTVKNMVARVESYPPKV